MARVWIKAYDAKISLLRTHIDTVPKIHPRILAILRDQEEECDRLADVFYTKGLTQEQVGDVFDEIYGQHYSKSSIFIS